MGIILVIECGMGLPGLCRGGGALDSGGCGGHDTSVYPRLIFDDLHGSGFTIVFFRPCREVGELILVNFPVQFPASIGRVSFILQLISQTEFLAIIRVGNIFSSFCHSVYGGTDTEYHL